MRRLLLIVVLACGGGHKPPATPAFKIDVDEVLKQAHSAPRDVAAPTNLAPTPWQIQQWALYRLADKNGTVGYMRYGVIRQDTCGLWFEQQIADRQHRLTVNLCVASPPDLTTVAQALIQVDGNQATPMNPPPRDITLAGAGWDQVAGAPREDIVVPAGTFAGAVKTTVQLKGVATTVWSHPAVPLAGTVKAEAANGVVTELVDFGE
jgi:hypothetical protein